MRPVNLLPDAHRPARASGTRGGIGYIVLGCLGGVLLAALLYMFTAWQATSREDEAARASVEAAEAEAEVASLAPFGDFRAVKDLRVEAVTNLAQSRIDWERLTRELALVLPRSTSLSSLEASTGADDAAGSESSSSSASTSEEAPEGPHVVLTGCAESQPSVARTLVRLRRLNGAEDVTLQESVKGTTGGVAAGSSGSEASAGAGECPGGQYGFNATVVLAEPTPTTAGPDTDVNVPASLGGGS